MVIGILYKQTAIEARIPLLRAARLLLNQNSVTNVLGQHNYSHVMFDGARGCDGAWGHYGARDL